MSLTKVGLGEIVKKQYLFKLRAYSGMFSTLMVLQAIGIFFSTLGGSSSGTWSSNVSVTVTYYSAEQVMIFTMLWIFISAILITTRAYREGDFTFVTSRMSNNLANGLMLLTASLIGGLSSYLSGFLIKVIIRFFDLSYLASTGLPPNWLELISGILAIILMMMLIGSLGYIIGTVIQLNKMFMVILPVLFIGFLFLANNVGDRNLAIELFNFYFEESSLILFTIKIVITTILLFIVSFTISNKQEVKL